MKLMEKHVKAKYPNMSTIWFTAWNPGGVEDLGDAMLYKVFQGVSENQTDLDGPFNELKTALGMRETQGQGTQILKYSFKCYS